MNTLSAYIDGIGLLGPGFSDWSSGRAMLAGDAAYQTQATVVPAPVSLPPAERRRCGLIIKLSLAVGFEAASMAKLDVTQLPTVFSASGGDGQNCHEICEMLATSDRLISPTRFHNSVHNAAAGYWSIAAHAMATSSALCAYDASFGAGLLEAMAQTTIESTPCLLIACDTAYPVPLRQTRPIPAAFGIALALAPVQSEQSVAKIRVGLTEALADQMADSTFEQLRKSIPAARGLPLLRAIAKQDAATMVIDYLDNQRLVVEVSPCA